jgi:hypothetical protein
VSIDHEGPHIRDGYRHCFGCRHFAERTFEHARYRQRYAWCQHPREAAKVKHNEFYDVRGRPLLGPDITPLDCPVRPIAIEEG